jgi:phage tail sheath gpL-like
MGFHPRWVHGDLPRYGGVVAYGGAAGYGAVVAQESAVDPGGPYTPVQIARSFFEADANHDGDLTRAEAMHLAIQPYSVEEIDVNHDGIITRFEYEDAVR